MSEPVSNVPAASRMAVAARSLLRFLPSHEPGPKTALTRLAIATMEATAYRAALTLLSSGPTGHRSTAKTASALFPRGPGKALSESITAWESGDSEAAGRLAQRESEEIRARLASTTLAELSRAAEREDLRFLAARQVASAMRDFFARPLFGQQAPRELQSILSNWLAYLRNLGFAEALGRRYLDLIEGSFPEPRSLLVILDAWTSQVERLPADGPSPSADEHPAASRTTPAPEEEPVSPAVVARDAIGRFTALGESLAERDLLGRQSLVDALASMCADRDQGTPFTLALIGEWGVGKSSVMNLLRRRLGEGADYRGRFASVWFSAWAYENTGNMAAALAQEIVGALLWGLGPWQKAWLRVRFAIRQHRWGVAWACLRLLVAVLLFPAARWTLRGTEPLLQTFLGVGLAAVLGAFAVTLRRDIKQLWEHPLAVELKTFLKLPDYGEHLGFLPVVREHLRALCDLRLGASRAGTHRLVCFVDDLDRCRSDTLMQTLEAIRLIMDEKDCIVILGFDYRIALAAVGERYKDFETEGRTRRQIARDYLGKVVQLAIRLDGTNGADLERFIAEQLFPVSPGALGKEAAGLAPSREPHPYSARRSGAREEAPRVERDPPSGSRAQPVNLALEMQHTVEERELFSQLAAEHRFTNPRLLLRLRNGYRLLRLIEAEFGHDVTPLSLLMRAIFWQEFLHQWPRETRRQLEAALFSPEEAPDALPAAAEEVLGAVAPQFQELLGRGEAAQSVYRSVAALAALLVLPHGD
jgi:hypothetical protein